MMLLAYHVTPLPVHIMAGPSKWLMYPLEIPNWPALMGTSYLVFRIGTPAPSSPFLPGGPIGLSQVCVEEECFVVYHQVWFENYSKNKLCRGGGKERETKRHTKSTPLFLLLILTDMKLLCQFSKHFLMFILNVFHNSPPALINSLEVGCIQGHKGKAWRGLLETPHALFFMKMPTAILFHNPRLQKPLADASSPWTSGCPCAFISACLLWLGYFLV